MLSLVEQKKIIPQLSGFLQRASGIAFCLVMRQGSRLVLRERMNQPCWGELRKYRSTHGDECTKQEDHRPSDLYHPFPKGIPEALAILTPAYSSYSKFIWSDNSPWVRGFGGESNIIISGKGVILKDTSIDPTVLVNLLKNQVRGGFNQMRELGLTEKEAGLLCVFTGVFNPNYYNMNINPPDTYTNAMTVDLKRYFESDPHDLTGGTLRDRFDYERKNLAGIFHNPEGVNLCRELMKHVSPSLSPYYGESLFDEKTIASGMKEVMKKYGYR